MKVLPFFLTQKQATLRITHLCLFLSHGGKSLWQTDEPVVSEEQLIQEYLLPNGFYFKQIWMENETFFVEIDSKKTSLSDFYTWEESLKQPQRPECWRSFYFFQDSANADWFTPNPNAIEAEIGGKSVQIYYEDILRHLTK